MRLTWPCGAPEFTSTPCPSRSENTAQAPDETSAGRLRPIFFSTTPLITAEYHTRVGVGPQHGGMLTTRSTKRGIPSQQKMADRPRTSRPRGPGIRVGPYAWCPVHPGSGTVRGGLRNRIPRWKQTVVSRADTFPFCLQLRHAKTVLHHTENPSKKFVPPARHALGRKRLCTGSTCPSDIQGDKSTVVARLCLVFVISGLKFATKHQVSPEKCSYCVSQRPLAFPD